MKSGENGQKERSAKNGNAITTPTKKKPITGTETTSESHFSSSAILNSPDPSCLPIPVFDDEGPSQSNIAAVNSVILTPQKSKTDALKTFLNLRS